MFGTPERTEPPTGEARTERGRGELPVTTQENERSGASGLMELVVARDNLFAALKRVRKNKGSPGIDGMTVEELPDYLRENWKTTRQRLLSGTYQPMAVKRQQIPKSDGGMRELGIPTVLDRFIQQAMLQVLQPLFDPSFSKHSHGFRPGHSAHQAVCEAQRYVQQDRRWVVDVDLERFFDRVNHDVLMGKLAKRIEDSQVLRLIRRYLTAGMMADGVVTERHEGTPQGGPLSPLLANVLLDEVDKELERNGHTFVRYADDCNVYVRSKRAGERVMERLRRLYGKLKLRVNEAKSTVALATKRQFLGFTFWVAPGRVVKPRVANKALVAFKDRVRALTRRTLGKSLHGVVTNLRSYLLGWKAYFRLASTPQVFAELDGWIRHRLRMYLLRQYKRGTTAYRELRAQGARHDTAIVVARYLRRWWHNAARQIHLVFTTSFFDQLGLPQLAA
jgi:group II intron reverse transcriptase/maturase